MTKNKFLRLTSLLVLLTVSLALSAQKQIVVFSTNDMHARIHNFGKIAAYIQEFRQQNPKVDVLVLSGGDLFSGNPVVDQYPEKGYPIVDLMNRVGYAYSAFGNHEFDYGPETLQKRVEQANFQFLCSNFQVDENCPLKQPEAYKIFKIGKIKVGIVGVIEATMHSTGKRHPSCHPDRVKGISFTDPVETIQEYKGLRKDCNLFLALSHAGYDQDLRIADAMPELDAIVGAHTHTKIDTLLLRNNVLVTQAGCYTEYLSKLTFTFKGKKLVNREYELIDVRKLKAEDQEISQMAQEFKDKSPLKDVLAQAVEQLDGKEELGGLMCDALVAHYHADMAFQNSGGVRLGQLKKGPITLEDVYSLDPFGNSVFVFDMTGRQIQDLLRTSHRNASMRADLMCSGLKYTIRMKDKKAYQVDLTDEQGNPLDLDKTYRVAMNSYIASSKKFEGTLVLESTDSASDALIEYLKAQKTIRKDIHRTQVVED